MPSLTRNVFFNTPEHKKLRERIESRIKFANSSQSLQQRKWEKAEDAVLAYVPESDLDAQRRVRRDSFGEPKYTTIQLPYTYALLMAAHTYMTSVFFGRTPIHQFAGRHGEGEDQVQALEALIGYQVDVGEMTAPYYLWIYDALKYGLGVIEESWEREIIQYATIQEIPSPDDPESLIRAQIRASASGYEGNRIGNISPFDFLPDPRVPVGQYQKGEFVFVRKRLSWEDVIRRMHQGFYVERNVKSLKREGIKDFAGISRSGSQLERPDDVKSFFEDNTKLGDHPAAVPVYEGCVSLIPSEWNLGKSDFPEKWMFTITGDLDTVLGAQPHGAMHGKFPYGVLEMEVEAYGTYNRGYPEIIEGLQQTMDWLVNQHFYNVRAALNNQFILDPSKIVAKDAETGGPGFTYRLRPEAYGQDIRTFFHQIPVQDVTRGHVEDTQTMFGIGERLTGINDQILGALSQGGRKTATEVRTSTGFGVNRLKTVAEYMSAVGFSQHTQRMVQTSQQYFDGEQKFRIAGSLISEMGPNSQEQFLTVNPDLIQGFFNFVPVDGTLPVDRLALANMWKEILLQMRTVPGLIQQFDLGRIFAHIATLAGVRNLNQFRIQVGSPQALAQQADAGNLVPIEGARNAAGSPTVGQTNASTTPAPAI